MDLSGWYFSDSAKNPLKWSFPQGTKLKKGNYLTIWCTGEEGLDPGSGSAFYTDFAISASGEKLVPTGDGLWQLVFFWEPDPLDDDEFPAMVAGDSLLIRVPELGADGQ